MSTTIINRLKRLKASTPSIPCFTVTHTDGATEKLYGTTVIEPLLNDQIKEISYIANKTDMSMIALFKALAGDDSPIIFTERR